MVNLTPSGVPLGCWSSDVKDVLTGVSCSEDSGTTELCSEGVASPGEVGVSCVRGHSSKGLKMALVWYRYL